MIFKKGTVSFISRILIVLLKTERGLTKISFMVLLHLRMNLFLGFFKEVFFLFMLIWLWDFFRRPLEHLKRFVFSPYKKREVKLIRLIWYVTLNGKRFQIRNSKFSLCCVRISIFKETHRRETDMYRFLITLRA